MQSANHKKIEDNKNHWDVKKSGERLLWRFATDEKGNYKSFTPNENDFVALKSVLGFINRQTNENVENNQLFAKLFIYHLTMEIRQFGTTVFNDYPLDKITKLLKTPLHLFCKAFYDDLHHNQLNKLVKYNDFNALVDEKIKEIRAGKISVPVYRNGIKSIKNITSDFREMTASEIEDAVEKEELKKISLDEQYAIIEENKRLREVYTLDLVTVKLYKNISESINCFS